MRAHVIENGKVINTIEVESLDFMPNLLAADSGTIGDLWDGTVFTKPARDLPAEKTVFIKQIDADADKVIFDTIGSREGEYELAEKEATSYAAAGYPASPVPASVLSEAIPKGLTNTQAATNILATATAWRTAQAALREARIARKFEASAAADVAALDAVKAAWAGFLVSLRSQLGV